MNSASPNFIYEDLPLDARHNLLSFSEETNVNELAIHLLLDIKYSKEDSLAKISEFILDLDPNKNSIKILFECKINKRKFLNELNNIDTQKEEYIKKNISDFFETSIYALCDESELEEKNRYKLVRKEWKAVNKLINLQVIHAKRDVASSESSQNSKKVLSNLTTTYFNRENDLSFDDKIGINKSIIEMDAKLNTEYDVYFEDFLNTSKEFLSIDDLRVVSDLQSKEILANHSKIVYGNHQSQLPEHLNGLGYMNILYLLLQIEIKKTHFEDSKKDINLLFIEEPEAHTHPQMQYVFIDKIKELLKGIPHLQTMITSHSSHIVNRCDFESIRYFLKSNDTKDVEIKNFHNELSKRYRNDKDKVKDKDERANFNFLQQYLTLNSSELFFAEKIIFIEGTTEKLLLPIFIKNLDKENKGDEKYKPLSSQNLSVMEVGANSKAFRHFIDFLNIKTLIITDIDTTKKEKKQSNTNPIKTTTSYPAAEVALGTHTSNYSIKYYLNAPDIGDEVNFNEWMIKLKNNKLYDNDSMIKVSYQISENGYHGRSFEDAFLSINLETIKVNIKDIFGIKNKAKLNENITSFYTLNEDILGEKSGFASSLLWLALSKNIEWKTPKYIKEGLLWIAA